MTPRFGYNYIDDRAWDDYQLAITRVMRPDLAKLNMYYDGEWSRPMFGSGHLAALLDAGCRTIILRTAETAIATWQVREQLFMPLPGGGSLHSIVRDHPEIDWVLEVGNEPDLAGADPWVHRWVLLTTAHALRPWFRQELPQLRWCASLSTYQHTQDWTDEAGTVHYPSADYFNALMADSGDGLGALGTVYDCLGVHAYGYGSLRRDDGAVPWAALDWAQGASDLPLLVTEAGINSDAPWAEKAALVVEALHELPERVEGVALFAPSLDPAWYRDTRYAPDVDSGGRVDWSFPGARVLSAR